MRIVSRQDSVPKPGLLQMAGAWLREVLHATRVFGWRQPFAWRAAPDQLERAESDACGIVFIHGFVCNRGFWTPWLREAQQRRHPYIALNLEPMFGSIDEYAGQIDRAVARLAASTGRPPALVCHSMGGLAARAWLRASGESVRVAHVVTIGSPHSGTWLARFSRRANGLQMRIGGRWLTELAIGGQSGGQPAFTCWYSNCDNIVFPPSTSTLPGADNRLLLGAAHVEMAFRPRLMRETFALLAAL